MNSLEDVIILKFYHIIMCEDDEINIKVYRNTRGLRKCLTKSKDQLEGNDLGGFLV